MSNSVKASQRQPFVKICCIKSIEEAKLAIGAGANAIGLVGKMPSGPGPIENETILEIAQYAAGKIKTFLLTSETAALEIIDHHHITQTTTIQLVDHVPPADLIKVKEALPHIELVQVIHVENDQAIAYALKQAKYVDYLLLDSGKPNATTKILGGTGNVHDWAISKEIVARSTIPVLLAGGIKAINVQQAMEQVAPFGLDLCTGVRTKDLLDAVKLQAFFQAVRV